MSSGGGAPNRKKLRVETSASRISSRGEYVTEQVTYYKPSSGDKLTIRVMNRDTNTCGQLAYCLYQVASRECPQPGLEGEPFRPNWVYEFANGLVFRLFD